MNAISGASPLRHGQTSPPGLPVGDLRGLGRVTSDAALCSLALDRAAGPLRASAEGQPLLALIPDTDAAWSAAYVPGTNVLETTARVAGGELRVVDFMALAEGRPGQGEALAAGRFVRVITCTEGKVGFRLACDAAVESGPACDARTADGWYLASSRVLTFDDGMATTDVSLGAGESVSFVIAGAALAGGPGLIADTLHGLGDTIHFWTWWSDRCRYRGEDFDVRLRDALGLKLACTPGGGILLDEPCARGFAPAPLGECARAAAEFLELGYRQECLELLGHVHALAGTVDAPRWGVDEWFIPTLSRYVERYGAASVPDALLAALPRSTPAQPRAGS